jgi:signal transduction histidine kinase
MYERVREMGGRIQIDSTVGKGTRVTVTVPAGRLY